jgi:hypothetical protein
MGRLSTCGRHRGPALLDSLGRKRGRGAGCRPTAFRLLITVALLLLMLGLGAP